MSEVKTASQVVFHVGFIGDSGARHASRRVLMPLREASITTSEENGMTPTPKVWTALFAVVVATCATGCVSTAPLRSAPNGDRAGGSAGEVVTMSELRRLDAGLSLMDALQRVRPEFLHPHGSAPTVSIDGSSSTDVSALRTIRIVDVQEVRLLRGAVSGGLATIRSDGAVVVGDVLRVVTRNGSE
jgi:hypothetical protein